jgi:glycosyltransferase involved in cell wall biosynthesis
MSGVHAYFAHAPAAVAERAAWHLSVPFGFSVHAKDARKVETHTLRARATRAACVVACNRDVAGDLRGIGAATHLVPHGVDFTRFAPMPHVTHEGLRVLAVGRLVEKKGFDVLVDALAATPPHASLRIIGDGPRRAQLTHQIAARGLGDRITLVDSCTHSTLPAEYAAADVVVVPSIVDGSGDRDGLPNVVLEAMACARAVVGTRAGAIESAIRHADTGLLVAPGCAASIATALRTLAGNAQLRESLGRRARATVEREYDVNRCVERFAGVLEAAYA